MSTPPAPPPGSDPYGWPPQGTPPGGYPAPPQNQPDQPGGYPQTSQYQSGGYQDPSAGQSGYGAPAPYGAPGQSGYPDPSGGYGAPGYPAAAYGGGVPGQYGDPSAPFGYDPQGRPYSDKQKLVAGLLQILLGGFGIGRFYTGHTGIGIAQIAVTLVTCGIGAIWGLIDGIMILVNGGTDSQGRPLRND